MLLLSVVYRGAILCLLSVFSATTGYRGTALLLMMIKPAGCCLKPLTLTLQYILTVKSFSHMKYTTSKLVPIAIPLGKDLFPPLYFSKGKVKLSQIKAKILQWNRSPAVHFYTWVLLHFEVIIDKGIDCGKIVVDLLNWVPQQHNEYNHFLPSEQTVQGFHQCHC